jgi:hypothetical protein
MNNEERVMNGAFDRYLGTLLKNWASSSQPPADDRQRLLQLAAAQAAAPIKRPLRFTSIIVALRILFIDQQLVFEYKPFSGRYVFQSRNDFQRSYDCNSYPVLFPMSSNLILNP